VVVAAACSQPQAAITGSPDPGVVHVHSLALGPGDGALYAATHTGLFKVGEDGRAERVGDRRHDLMGFTAVGPRDFIASGHPDLTGSELNKPDTPPLLGLVTSSDGVEWQPVSLFGQADFHALVAAHDRIYGWDSTGGRFMVTVHRTAWEVRSQVQLLDFAVSPAGS
jgi:hypothetical protein